MTTKKPPVRMMSLDDLIAKGYRHSSLDAPEQAPAAAEAPPKKAGLMARMGDVGLSVLKGTMAVPESAIGLANLVTGGYAGKAAEAAGFRPGEARQIIDSGMTPEQQAANRAVQEADGFNETLGAAIANPSTIVNAAAESVPLMLGGGVVARGLMRAVSRMSGAVAAGAGEGLMAAGSQAEQIRQQTSDGTLSAGQALTAAGSGALTGALGVVAGKLANRLGIGDVDQLVAGVQRATPDVQKGFVRKMLEGAVSEGVLEELPQSIQEQVAQNYALDKPLDEGVDQAAVMGMLSGGLMGGAAGPMRGSAQADQIRAAKVPASGPLSRAANAGVEAQAKAAENWTTSPGVGQPSQAPAAAAQPAAPDWTTELGIQRPAPEGTINFEPVPIIEDAGLALGDQTEIARKNVERATGNYEPMPWDGATKLANAAKNAGHDMTVVKHPSGDGFTVVQRRWVTRQMVQDAYQASRAEENARKAMASASRMSLEGEPPQTPLLGMDTRPTGRMLAGQDGQARPETRMDWINTGQRVGEAVQRRQAKNEMGLTPDVERAQVDRAASMPSFERDLVAPSGKPFSSRRVAEVRAIRAGKGFEVAPVDGGFVVRDTAQDARQIGVEPLKLAGPQQEQSKAEQGGQRAVGMNPASLALEGPKAVKKDAERAAPQESAAQPSEGAGDGQEEGWRRQEVLTSQGADVVPSAPASTAPQDNQPFTHAGLNIRPSRVKFGDEVKDKWVVQSPENAEREARGERQIGGDRVVDTREQAIKTAEQETNRYATEKASRAEIEASDKARIDAAEAKKEANRSKTILERRADAVLDKPSKLPASAGLGLGTKREAMDKAIEQNRQVVEVIVSDTAAKKRDQEAVDAVRQAGYILGVSNENIPVVKKGLEARARLKEGKYQMPEYRVYQGSDQNGSFFEITKTEYDYAQKVKAATYGREVVDTSKDKRIGTDINGRPVYEGVEGSLKGVPYTFDERGRVRTGVAMDDGEIPPAESKPDQETAPKPAGRNPLATTDKSWVIREKATGVVVMETSDRKKVEALNTKKYGAVPIREHLAGLSGKQSENQQAEQPTEKKIPAPVARAKAAREKKLAGQNNKPLLSAAQTKRLAANLADPERQAAVLGRIMGEVEEQTAATHADPGQAPEPVTPAVVRESMSKAADNEDRKPSAMKAELLGMIDAALKEAPDHADFLETVKTMGEKDAVSVWTSTSGAKMGERFAPADYSRKKVFFNVKGDGKFTVNNTVRSLLTFRKVVEASGGFKDRQTKPAPDRVSGKSATFNPHAGERFGVESGSGGKQAAFDNMVNEGDLEAASDYADAVGLDMEPKNTNAIKVLQWREERDAKAEVAAINAALAASDDGEAKAAAPSAPVTEPVKAEGTKPAEPEANAEAVARVQATAPDELPNPWEISQDEFVRRTTFIKEGSTAFPWVAKWGDRILEAENEVFDHPDLGKTVVQGGRFSKTKREAEAKARGAHKRAVRRGVLNGYTATPEALAAYPDLRPAKPAAPAEPPKAEQASVPDTDAVARVQAADKASDAAQQDSEPPADRLEQEAQLWAKLTDGAATVDEFKAGFEAWVRDKAAIIERFGKLKKAELLSMAGGHFAYRHKTDTKPEIAAALWSEGMGRYGLGRTVSYTLGAGGSGYQGAVAKLVDATGDDQLKAYADEHKQAAKEAGERVDQIAEALKEPKTLADFNIFLRAEMSEGKTFKEARLGMTPEQRAKFDELAAEVTRDQRDARKRALKTELKTSTEAVGGQVIETTHTQKGHALFVVQLEKRIDRADYDRINASAKKLGGFYSSFRGRGAVPGFQFRDRPSADAFLKLAAGDTADAKAIADQRRDAFEDDRSQSAAERLVEMADRLEGDANASMALDRKQNTARRARFAAAAERAAGRQKAMAATMRNLAAAISDGRAKFLDAVRQKVQVEFLEQAVATAKDAELRTKYKSYAEQQQHAGEPETSETADFAEFPSYTAMRSDLASLGRQLLEVDGTKKLGKQLLGVADDVTDSFKAWAKEEGNLSKLMVFSEKGSGKAAQFGTEKDAEDAIARSGYKGRAIPWQIKRGQWAVVSSPSEAMERGVWKGDGDKRISLSAEFGSELVEQIGKAARRGGRVSVPWQFEAAHSRRKLLSRMGIETPAEYRSALREFIAMRQMPEAPSKVRELERAMVGRQNDGLDFFPTPAEAVDAMIDTAEIQPGMRVLEPSAGWGHIAERLAAIGASPEVVELSNDRRELLQAKGFNVVGDDFMAFNDANHENRGFTYGDLMEAADGTRGLLATGGGMGSDRVSLVSDDQARKHLGYFNYSELVGVERRGVGSGYDRILMNPPFSDRRDATHVQHAYSLLKPGGRLVAIMGEGVFFGQDKRAQAFRDWLDSVGGTSEKLAEGTFNDPSLPVNTSVNARMVVIEKPVDAVSTSPAQEKIEGDVALRIDNALTPAEKSVVADAYGRNTFDAEARKSFVADVVKAIQHGLDSIQSALHDTAKKVISVVLAAAAVFNPNFIGDTQAYVIHSRSDYVQQAEKQSIPFPAVPDDASGMSPAARTAYVSLMAGIGADLKTRDKLMLIVDKPTARVFIFKPDGSLLLKQKVLLGKALGDDYKGGNDNPKNRITPAGLFKLGLRDATRSDWERKTAGEYEYGKVFVLDKAIDGEYSVTMVHSVWTHEKDAERRLSALKNDDANDARYSFGCINVDKATYKRLLDGHQAQMDGAMMFVVPDNQARLKEFLNGNVNDGLTRYRAENKPAQAADGADSTGAPVASRPATMGRGVSMRDAKAVAASIRAALPSAPPIHLLEKINQAPKVLHEWIKATGAEDLEAAYHDGEIYVFPRNIESIERMQFVVAHHEIRHHGIRAMLGTGDDLGAAMHAMWAGNKALRKAAQAKIDAGLASSRVHAVEEALADMPVEEVAKFNGFQRVVAAIRQWLRKVAEKMRKAGMTTLADAIDPKTLTDADVARFVMRAEGVSRGDTAIMRAGDPVFSQRVWHGTPHRGIEKFSTDKIGTGEGAQAYGWGLYFASKKEVAEHYRRTLSGDGLGLVKIDGRPQLDDPEFGDMMVLEVDDRPKTTLRGAAGYKFMRTQIGQYQGNNAKLALEWLAKAETQGKSIEVPGRDQTGQLYAAEIPEDSEMLLWDKPLSEQPRKVRMALDGMKIKALNGVDPASSGEAMYRGLAAALMTGPASGTDAQRLAAYFRPASEALAARGIKGIKYLDGTSRNAGDGSYNYVIFSGDDVTGITPMFSRPADTRGFAGQSSTITVDGKERPTTNSSGQPIHPTEEGVRNFWRWFGDSRVVDADGKPLVVYHGTPNGGFSAFSPATKGSRTHNAADDVGYHFTSDPGYAEAYSEGYKIESIEAYRGLFGSEPAGTKMPPGASTYPVYLSIKNPLNAGASKKIDKALIDRAISAGHDGIVADMGGAREYVAFRPEQIKSSTGNAGTFDPQSPSIVFSRPAPAGSAQAQARVSTEAIRQNLSDIFGSAGAKMTWWDKTLGTQYNKAERFPETFGKVFKSVQAFYEDTSRLANEAADNAPSILPKLESLGDVFKGGLFRHGLSAADSKAIAAPVFKGTLEDEKVYSDDELTKKFGLDERQRGLYREFRAATDEALDQTVAADVVRHLGNRADGVRNLVVNDRGMLRTMVTTMVEDDAKAKLQAVKALENELKALGDKKKDEGEEAADKRATLKAKIKTAEAVHKNAEDLRATIVGKYERGDDLKAKGYAPLMRFGKFAVNVSSNDNGESLYFGLFETRAEANRAARELADEFRGEGTVSQGVMSAEQHKLFAGVPVEAMELFANALGAEQSEVFQEWLKLTKNNRSAMKRMIHRKGTAGFSQDATRVLASFVTSSARFTSGVVSMDGAQEVVRNIKDGDVKDEAIKLLDVVSNPAEVSPVGRGLLFFNFLGGSVASALVNMTQPVTMTAPYLSQWGGLAVAGKRLASAAKMVVGGKIADDELAKALKRAEDEGVVSPQEIHHLQAEASGRGNIPGANALNPFMRKLAFVWGGFFGAAEQFNRRVSFIAAYQTAQAEGMADPFGFAEKAVIETQGLYNKGNAPNWARTPVGALALTFKQFSIHYMEWLVRMAKSGPAGKKAAVLALAMLAAAGGAEGLPFAEDVADVLDTVAQALGYDFSTKRAKHEFIANTLGLGDGVADVFDRGLSAVPGVPLDVSARMGMGNLVPATGLLLRSNTDKSRDLFEVAGAAGGLAKQYMGAAEKALQGKVLGADGALAATMPVAIQNLIKGWNMLATGQYTDTKGRNVMEADTLDAAMKAVGFQPQAIASESRKIGEGQRSIALANNVESEFVGRLARANIDGKPEDAAKVRQELRQWNEDNPGARIVITPAQVAKRAREMRTTREQRFLKTAPKEMRPMVKEAMQ